MEWKHPSTIVKHCPPRLVKGGLIGHNTPPRRAAGPRKPIVNAETERLKALLIQVIKRLAKHELDALELLDQIMPRAEPVDSVDDLYAGPAPAEA
jgi:hypothetical protein